MISWNEKMRKLLLLDLDGTLINTPHYEAWRYAAHQIGVEDLTYEEYIIYLAGRSRLEGASRLIECKRNSMRVALRCSHDSNALAEIKQLEFLRLSANTRLFDDALRLLGRVETSQQHVKFYTASLNAPRLFRLALRRSGKTLNPPVIVQQRRGQTREELLLYLARGHASETVALIDDAPHAVDAACRLGIRGYQIRRNEFQPAATDPSACILPSLDEITVPIGDAIKDIK